MVFKEVENIINVLKKYKDEDLKNVEVLVDPLRDTGYIRITLTNVDNYMKVNQLIKLRKKDR